MRKMLFNLVACLCMYMLSFHVSNAQGVTVPPSGWNQKAEVTQYIGLVKVNIHYSSPDVTGPNGKSRKGEIWGKLVPHGMNNLGFGPAKESPWRAGANENTVFTVSHEVEIEGKKLPAGSYGLHMITQPKGKDWTLIFSKNTGAWGSYFYNPSDDILRVKVSAVENSYHEWLTYGFDDRQPQSATAYMAWENMKVPFKVSVPNLNDLYVANIRQELQGTPGFNWQNWVTAVNFCVGNNINLEEALAWSDNAINAPFIGQKNYTTLQTRASVLKAMGKDAEAEALSLEAVKHHTATVQQVHQYGRQLLAQGKKEQALEIFEWNAQQHPNTWPVNVGLTRAYSALGKYKKALKHAKLAKENVPQNDSLNANSLTSMIAKLEKGEDVN